MNVTKREFRVLTERIVRDVFKSLPEDMRDEAAKVVIQIEDMFDSEDPDHPDNDLLGLFEGTPINERRVTDLPFLPDTVTIYRVPLMQMCRSERELTKEIRITVIHELGHYFGYGEEDLEKLGLA